MENYSKNFSELKQQLQQNLKQKQVIWGKNNQQKLDSLADANPVHQQAQQQVREQLLHRRKALVHDQLSNGGDNTAAVSSCGAADTDEKCGSDTPTNNLQNCSDERLVLKSLVDSMNH